ncbi:MAG TPA: FGGY-family carbohydrate kinase [Acidobacteriaceae bacterium]|nr:FGGY-family carbohydrate kinase [Acidobacteriaceae bacterium]
MREIRDSRALVAIDLGAESCRISLLRWLGDEPEITMVHRIANGPLQDGKHLYWPLERILTGVEEGLRKAAAAAPEGIRSIAVDGWAVDYVRLGANGKPVAAPFCYRDERTLAAKIAADALVSPDAFFAQTGAQPLRINTVYQLVADARAGHDTRMPWMLLPEYVLHWLGGRRVTEYTNATHTGLVDLETGDWSRDLFERLGLALEAAPEIVHTGSRLGKLRGELASLPAFSDTELIAPACHDTASAIAAIAGGMERTAYIVSGTWSLVGTVVEKPIHSNKARRAGFTNQGAAAGGYCFHTNVNGMWLVKQCLDHWCGEGRVIDIPTLIAGASEIESIPGFIDVDAPELLLAGEMPARINAELSCKDFPAIADVAGNEAIFARVIFASLARRYAEVLRNLESLCGSSFERITILGGGSRNALLRKLTEESTGLPVVIGEAEGSTLGNFAVQLAALEDGDQAGQAFAERVQSWAARLALSDRL